MAYTFTQEELDKIEAQAQTTKTQIKKHYDIREARQAELNANSGLLRAQQKAKQEAIQARVEELLAVDGLTMEDISRI